MFWCNKNKIIAGVVLLGCIGVAGVVRHEIVRLAKRPVVSDVGVPIFDQQAHDATGFGVDAARVDSQITLKIPEDQVDAVYAYLKEKYVGKSGILTEQFPKLNLHGQPDSDVSIFTDAYFDSPRLDLYRTSNSARHRTRINTTNPEDRKSGRELVQVKVTPPGKFNLRTELKYEVALPDEQTDKKIDPSDVDERHPLIRLIEENQRADFKNAFSEVGLSAYSLKHIFTITQTRSRVYINWDDVNIMSFSVDHGSAGILWAKGSFASVDAGLVEVAYTGADEAKRKIMWDIRDALIKDLTDHFPALTVNNDSKYAIILTQLIDQIRAIPFLIAYGLL